jgi:hypothetical protein
LISAGSTSSCLSAPASRRKSNGSDCKTSKPPASGSAIGCGPVR